MADVILVGTVLLWVCGALVYLGAMWSVASKRVGLRRGVPFIVVGAGAFLWGSYYVVGPVFFVPFLALVLVITAFRIRASGKR